MCLLANALHGPLGMGRGTGGCGRDVVFSSPPLAPSAGLPGRCDPAACLFVVWEQPVCHYFFWTRGALPPASRCWLLPSAYVCFAHLLAASLSFFFFLECVHRFRGEVAAAAGQGMLRRHARPSC